MYELNTQLKRGVTEILVLQILSNSDSYGYLIIQELTAKSGGSIVLKEGTLYPILYRLEDAHCIESYWEQNIQGRQVPKKYYRITSEGRSKLLEMRKEWIAFQKSVNQILEV